MNNFIFPRLSFISIAIASGSMQNIQAQSQVLILSDHLDDEPIHTGCEKIVQLAKRG